MSQMTEEERKTKEDEEKKKKDSDIKGYIYIKAEWKGNGPKLPPIKSENLLRKHKVVKNRNQFTEE